MFEVGSAVGISLLAMVTALAPVAVTAGDPPWGGALASDAKYAPRKVVYDVAVSGPSALEGVLDRVSYLNNLYGADPFWASIVVVRHGDRMPLFAVADLSSRKAMRTCVECCARHRSDRDVRSSLFLHGYCDLLRHHRW
jgi:hypothetical protein